MANKGAVNPYTRLLSDIKSFCFGLKYRHTKTMFSLNRERVYRETHGLIDLYERAIAAGDLGYDVHVVATPSGLNFQYVKKIPEIPWDWKL